MLKKNMYVPICKNVLSTIQSLPATAHERKHRLLILIEFIVKEIGSENLKASGVDTTNFARFESAHPIWLESWLKDACLKVNAYIKQAPMDLRALVNSNSFDEVHRIISIVPQSDYIYILKWAMRFPS